MITCALHPTSSMEARRGRFHNIISLGAIIIEASKSTTPTISQSIIIIMYYFNLTLWICSQTSQILWYKSFLDTQLFVDELPSVLWMTSIHMCISSATDATKQPIGCSSRDSRLVPASRDIRTRILAVAAFVNP